MICKKCNKKQSLFAHYCEDCGTKLERNKMTKDEKKKIRNVTILVLLILTVFLVSYKTICYVKSPEYQAISYFQALINNDIEKIATYLNVTEDEFVNQTILSEKLEVMENVKNYQITAVDEYQDYLIVSIRYTTNRETKMAYVKLVRTNDWFHPYEVISGKIVENIKFKVPKGAVIKVDGVELSNYRKETSTFDIYELPNMIKGNYQISISIDDITIEDTVEISESETTYTISNISLEESLKDTILTKTKEELNLWYSSLLSKKSFDEIKEQYLISSKDDLRSSYNSFKRTMSEDINMIDITDLEIKKVSYSNNGKLCITYLVDKNVQTTENKLYTSLIQVEYEYINGNYEIYNIIRK